MTLLQDVLTQGLTPRTTPGPAGDAAALLGRPLPSEIATLLEVNVRYPLDTQEWGELRPLYFKEPFAFAGPDAAAQHLERVTTLDWPVYFEAHFWNAFPIGATPGGDYWLAQVQTPDGDHSPVYRYDHETAALTREEPSITELVRQERSAAPPDRHAGGKATKPPKEAVPLDPAALQTRSAWLTAVLRGQALELDEELATKAPAFTAFAKEKAALVTAPHLALYWLFAHMMLGNRTAFAEAYAATAATTHAFVASARELCKRLLEDDTVEVGALTTAWRAEMRELLEQIGPARVLDTKQRAALKKRLAGEEARVVALSADLGPLAMLEARPLDLGVQLATLKAIAATESPTFQHAVELLTAFAKKGGSPGESKWPEGWRELFADPRFENLLLICFRRGQEKHLFEPFHSDWFIDPLAKIGGPRVTEAFMEALLAPGHHRRWTMLAHELHASREPRVVEFFSRLDKLWTSAKLPTYDRRDVVSFGRTMIARDIALGDHAHLERTLAGILAARVDRELQYHAAGVAAAHGFTALAEHLVTLMKHWVDQESLGSASAMDFFELGASLAVLAPTRAAAVFAPVWTTYVGGGSWAEATANGATFAIGTALLVPLLGSSARADYLAPAKASAEALAPLDLESRKTSKEWSMGALYLLRALRLSGDPFARALATSLRARTFSVDAPREAIAAEIALILDR